MVKRQDLRPLRPFAVAFAKAYFGLMKEREIDGKEIAHLIGRNPGYVSERVNGLRAIDTDMIDALATLVGMDGASLLDELGRRATSLLATRED